MFFWNKFSFSEHKKKENIIKKLDVNEYIVMLYVKKKKGTTNTTNDRIVMKKEETTKKMRKIYL